MVYTLEVCYRLKKKCLKELHHIPKYFHVISSILNYKFSLFYLFFKYSLLRVHHVY